MYISRAVKKAASHLLFIAFSVVLAVSPCLGDDSPQWGEAYTHNNVSSENSLPVAFEAGKKDSSSGRVTGASENVRFAVRLGKTNYAPPIISGGKVLIGTNDCEAYDPVAAGDRGVLLCFDEKSGELAWKLALPKFREKRFFDFENTGMVSPPTVVGNRAYLVSNRCELLCLDMNGLADGNDGPFKDEGKMMTDSEKGQSPYVPTDKDADIIWCLDMHRELGVRQHDSADASIVICDGLLYLNTTNGLNEAYSAVENPEAPSLLVVDSETGRPLACDDRWVGEDVVHGQWSSPSIAKIGDRNVVLFCGGNGVMYGFNALERKKLLEESIDAKKLHRIKADWFYNGQPWADSSPEPVPFRIGRGSPSFTSQAPPVICNGKAYAIFGTEGWIGERPRKSRLVCIDLSRELSGDVTKTAAAWSTDFIEDGLLAAPTIKDGLLYYADRKGNLNCLDANTGEVFWTEKLKGDFWAAPLLADGKIYIGSERRTLFVMQAGKTAVKLGEIQFNEPIYSSAVAANKTLFIATASFLYAIE